MEKNLKKLFIVLIFSALADGIFYNFQELWLAENNLNLKSVSLVLSLCALIAVPIVFLCSNLITRKKLKNFICNLMFVRIIFLVALFILNGTGLNFLIKFITMFEYGINVEILVSIYPLMSIIAKDDKTFGKKDVYYNMFYYIGILITGLLIGKNIFNYNIGYNTYCLSAAICSLIAFIMLVKIDLKVKDEEEKSKNLIIHDLLVKISKDKISIYYLIFLFINQATYKTIQGLAITFLTNSFNFSPSVASGIRLALGLASAIFAVIVLKWLTSKNDVVNLFVKYVLRAILFVLALIFRTNIMYFIAFAYPLFTSSAYSHITCAPYINRFEGKYQLAFCNLREMMSYLGYFVGIYICGAAYKYGIWYNFLIALILIVIQLIFTFAALYLRKKEENSGRK